MDEDGATRARPAYVAGIAAAADFRLFLHRHWSLYDALQYSPYVAPRMQVRPGGAGGATRPGPGPTVRHTGCGALCKSLMHS